MWYFNHTIGLQDSFSVSAHDQGNGVVNTIMSSVSMMQDKKILRNGDLFLNWDFTPSAVIINFKNLKRMQGVFDWRKREYISELGAIMTRYNYRKSMRSSSLVE